jgi:hypothetical protein
MTGLGLGAYIIELPNYKKNLGLPHEHTDSAENYFFQIGSELGIIGLVLAFWLFMEIIKQMRKSWKEVPSDDNNKFILMGAISGLFALFISYLFHSYIGSYEVQFTFWVLVGIIFGVGKIYGQKEEKVIFSKNFKISSLVIILIFCSVHLWNSTHSLSLKSRTEQLGIKQDCGFYEHEKTNDGREFRWTREYGGLTVKIEKSIIEIPLLASHPDIKQKPVRVKIYLIKDFFKQKKLLDDLTLTQDIWKKYEYDVSQEVGQELILLVKVNRTWNPFKTVGTPDPRNLGVAMGKIEFKDKIDP